ncbi:MAG: hypothetical protein Q9207_006638 [Kuettlingeria erythrocarpa]
MPVEFSPALALLDRFITLHVEDDPDNIYKASRIGNHDVVMVVLGKIGLGRIPVVAASMHKSFRHLKHLLVVGLGGGRPDYALGEQMVLGDVVVSTQVEHVDCGRRATTGFEYTYQTNLLSPALQNAVNTLRSLHSLHGTRIPQALQRIREKFHPTNIRDYPEDPGPDVDRLFDPDYHYKVQAEPCENCCDPRKSKSRYNRGPKAHRDKDSPFIHYGIIGSGNSLVVATEARDILFERFGAIYFEMEAAALMDDRCLVIRGISDYSDSHKNKAWQAYAATTAAAYAQELILQLPAPDHGASEDRPQKQALNNEESSTSQEKGPVDTTGLCLLSLDGGGVRGLSTLYILKSIFRQLNHERSLTDLPPVKPCDVFDLIGGTSTGGLLALMLGRLKMDIDECISCYTELMRKIFATRTSRIPVPWRGKSEGRFDSSTLRSAIEEVITKYGFSKREPLEERNAPGCKVFVCATASETTNITLLKSYTPREGLNISSTICEAALATSATTSFFQPVHIGARKFVDGALRANNPAEEVEKEARSIWYDPRVEFNSLVKCFVSIGTGHLGKKPIEDNAAKFLATKTLVDIVTETESTADSFINRWRQQHEAKRYFRFSVHQGLQDVSLEEHNKQGTIEAATYEYVGHTEQKSRVRDCVQNLKTKQNKAKANFAADVDEYNTRRIITLHKGEACLSPAVIHFDYQMLTSLDLDSKTAHVHWTVYRSRNPLFTGRDDILRDLEATIRDAVKDPSYSDRCTIVISGMGGQGKSEICLQLAYRVRQTFWGVFWVDVSATSSAKIDFLNIAKKLGIPAESMEEAQQGLANVRQSCLLVLDNADDPDVDYQRYFPAGLLGVVLLTSRNAECHQYASPPELARELEGLPENDAQELLLHATNTPREQWSTFQDDAQRVATLLQSHPLALIQAGAYISRAHCTIAGYPLVFDRQRKRLLKYRPTQAKSRYGDVYATFEASAGFLQVSQEEAAKDALQLLSMLGICAASRLPLQRLFEEGWKGTQTIISSDDSDDDDLLLLTPWHVSHLPSLLQAGADAWDPFRLVEAVRLLKAFSLVSADTQDDPSNVSMHPLTNAWALDRLATAAQHNAWLATGCLVAVSHHDDIFWRELGRQLQPHLEALTSLDMKIVFASEPRTAISSIIMHCGLLLLNMRDDTKLEELMDNLMVYLNLDPLMVDATWSPVYELIASNLMYSGKVRNAVLLREQLVQIREQTQAKDHPDRLAAQHELASVYEANGQVEKAITLLEPLVQIWEQTKAKDHPDRLASQHQLAFAYHANGEVEKAITLLEQLVQIREQTLAEDHRYRLAAQHELASAYHANGEVEKAVPILEQVVQIREQTLAKTHPDRLASQHELARAYKTNKQLDKAVPLLEQVIQIREQTLAKDHPALLASQHNMATSLWRLGCQDAALQIMEHVVEVEKEVLDERHPDRIISEALLKFFEDMINETKAAENCGGSEASDSSASDEGGV